MNATKAAAVLALTVAIAASGYLLYELYENVFLLRSSIDAFDGIAHSGLLEYWLPAGVAVVALITSLASFGSAKTQGGR